MIFFCVWSRKQRTLSFSVTLRVVEVEFLRRWCRKCFAEKNEYPLNGQLRPIKCDLPNLLPATSYRGDALERFNEDFFPVDREALEIFCPCRWWSAIARINPFACTPRRVDQGTQTVSKLSRLPLHYRVEGRIEHARARGNFSQIFNVERHYLSYPPHLRHFHRGT